MKWISDLQPTALSESYTVQLEYSLEITPKIIVNNPVLLPRGDEGIPHLYPDGSLCLYLPSAQEWDKSMALVDTIIPWASEWLAHYELWHATGKWHGGGVHPRKGKNK